jgi:uncharacterized cupredoxin-like copper-binding protein
VTSPTLGRRWLIAGLVSAIALLVGSGVAVAAWSGGAGGAGPGATASAPDLPGTVVHVAAGDMGGRMMGQGQGQGQGQGRRQGMARGVMFVRADQTTVPAGTVSLLVTNTGTRDHELVVLPLDGDQPAGARTIGADNRVDETGSLGEASRSGGEGAGEGIAQGTSGWVTLTLPPGRYELLCNLPGHYAAGMYTELTVA